MIDPHHIGIGLARRKDKAKQALNRKLSDSSSKAASKQLAAQRATSTSQSDLPPLPASAHHGPSHFKVPNISSYTSAAKGGSSTSTSTSSGGSNGKTLAQRNPELEYFKQQNLLNNELTPRTSDFFSKRRTSISGGATPTGSSTSGTVTGASTPSAAVSKAGTIKKVHFQESDELRGESLPVRLGLAPPRRAAAAAMGEYKAQVGHGYYFCLPPPQSSSREKSSSGSGSSLRARPEQRRDTGAWEGSTNSSRYSVASGSLSTATGSSSLAPPLRSPALAPDSPLSLLSDWNSSSIDSGYTSKGLSPSAAESGRFCSGSSAASHPLDGMAAHPRARGYSFHSTQSGPARSISGGAAATPESSSSPSSSWHPNDYFVTWKRQIEKGRVHEYRHHGFPRSKVPYWYGYDLESIEAEQDIHLCTYLALNGSHVLRKFPEEARPSRVLDMGSGAGAWCTDMAREWPQAEFIGLDVCPIQPPMATMRNPDLERRVSWVVANFLEKLPFPDNSFDFIHMRYLGSAIPEDRWSDVISEIERVLAPDGKVELIENNFHFYGRVEMVDAEELFKLQHCRPANANATANWSAVKPKLLQPIKGPSLPTGAYDIDAIQIVVERTISRRFINTSPLSVIPSMLLTEGLTNVAIGNPRHIPLSAESARQRALARAHRSVSASTSPPSSDNDEKWKEKYTSRSQIGQPLNSTFHIQNSEVWRALGFLFIARNISGARELIWLEAEEEKQLLLRAQPLAETISAAERLEWDSQRSFNQSHPASLKPFAHPWENKTDFFKQLDLWMDDLVQRADMEGLVEKHLGWHAGSEELTVEGRKEAERQKKLDEAAALLVAQPDDRAAAMVAEAVTEESNDSVAQQPQQQQPLPEQGQRRDSTGEGDDDETLGRSSPLGFSVAASQPYHEAPGRLQTTRADGSGSGGAEDEDLELLDKALSGSSKAGGARNRKESSTSTTARPAEGKRRKPIRSTSSGGAGIAFGGVAMRPPGRSAVTGETNLYSNLFMVGGLARHIPLIAPAPLAGTRTPSQRAAAEFTKSGSSGSGGGTSSIKSSSTSSTGKAAKTTSDDRSTHGSVGSGSAVSGRRASEKSPADLVKAAATATTTKEVNPIISLSEPAALLLGASSDSPSVSSAPAAKVTASNVFDIPPASPPQPHARPSTGGRSVSTPAPAPTKLQHRTASTVTPAAEASKATSSSPAAAAEQSIAVTSVAAESKDKGADAGAGSARRKRAQIGLMGFFDTTGYMAEAV